MKVKTNTTDLSAQVNFHIINLIMYETHRHNVFLSLNNSSVENTEPVSLPNIAVTTKETPVIKSGK